MREAKIRAKRHERYKLNNEGIALIYALIAGTVAMVFCLMLLMISYNLYSQVSADTTDLQLRIAAESFENALKSEFNSADSNSSLSKYIDTEIRKEQVKKNKNEEYSDELNLMVYYNDDYGDGNSMGNYCVFLTVGYELNDTSETEESVAAGGDGTVPVTRNLDVTIKCMRGLPYNDGDGYRLDDGQSYTIHNSYIMNVKR